MARPPIQPNLLTALRLPLAPLAIGFLITETTWGVIVAAVLALLVEATDIADGQIARRYGAVTNFGKLFDPFADAFTRYTLFLGLYAVGAADLWMVVAIFYRDSAVSFFRSVAATRQVVLAARWSGKLKAVVQGIGTQAAFAALVLSQLLPEVGWLGALPWWFMLIMTLVTLYSFVDYFRGNYELLRAAWSEGPVA